MQAGEASALRVLQAGCSDWTALPRRAQQGADRQVRTQ